VDLAAQWLARLHADLDGYAQLALENIAREYPSLVSALLTGPGQFPARPRDRTPVFFGSLDWHSCVEMHWVLVRLLKVAPDAVPAAEIRAALDRQFTAAGLAAEAEFIKLTGTGERHYGWGWALTLVHELATWEQDPDALRWAAAMEPLASAVTANFLGWLSRATYPIRTGLHANSSFALSLTLPYAQAAARAGWLGAFLPGIAAAEPATLFTPAVVSDASDGQIAHLHGLNLSRAWCWRRLAETLPAGDARVLVCVQASGRNAEAALSHVVGDDYMVGHWLAAYAVLMFS
jgi:hypothetical protein